ncbi:MAG: beta-glucosidase [Acidimicrobiia bacterium]|nr:MAG: beta-glucosidase [Acidimicrobiia bacterium]
MDSARIEELVGGLTIEEKAAMVAGVDMWHTAAAGRLGVPAMKVTDGPIGARGERWTGGRSHAFPCGTALGATWDPELVEAVGRRLGVETRRKRAHVLLAPTVNIHRHPFAGRNFECFSEDPYLTARLAVAYVRGVQSQGVGCSVKHFVANDQEHERMTISSEVDERTLREIYLPPFEAAVREAHAVSVMAAYNRLNGTFCSEHRWLLSDLLKGEWGFDGFVVSDWFGAHSTAAAANAGLDVEMPGPPQWFGTALARAVGAGEVDQAVLDDKVRRILVALDRTGAFGDPAPGAEESVDDPEDRAVARRAAAAGFVLLSNRRAALPLDGVRTLAVVGPNADVAHVMGGGSARVPPHPLVTPLEGLRLRFPDVGIRFERGATNHKRIPPLDTRRCADLRVAYHAGRERAGAPVLEEPASRAWFTWLGPVGAGVPDDFSARVLGTFVADEPGAWTFSLVQAGRARLLLDGEVVLDNWEPTGRSDAFFGFGSEEVTVTVDLDAGAPHELVVEFVPAGPALGALGVGCLPPTPDDLLERAVEAAASADAAVCVVGTDGEWETEGNDRESMDLPGGQDDLVRAVAAANPRTIVVVNAGAPVTMPWRDEVAAILQCWFPGEEWGNALADVLSGDVSPSGKLPTTFPVRVDDVPSHAHYPGAHGRVEYAERLHVGYRGFDSRGIEPAFCFGHGLSYTTFELGTPAWDLTTGSRGLRIVVPVRNTGSRRGAEVVQCYVHDVEATVERPVQELRAFAKVWLDPGEEREVELSLDERAFAFWHPDLRGWTVEPGTFEIRIGTSSRDVHHRFTIELP